MRTQAAARLGKQSGRPPRGRVLALLLLVTGLSSCLLSPVRMASSVEGRVVDAVTGEPLEGAVVVVRYDGRYGEVLPDREVLGHLEARTDATGRFEVGPLVRPGIALYPYFTSEARVAAVLHEGYRCAQPVAVRFSRQVTVRLQPALDQADRRDSCRPVPAEPGEARGYMTAWRALHSDAPPAADSESDRQLDRLLQARAAFGFGENCRGPVVDLALAPGGTRAALLTRGDGPDLEIGLLALEDGGFGAPARVGRESAASERRLAWTGPEELVLWGEAPDRAASASVFAREPIERVWASAVPAAPSPGASDTPLSASLGLTRPLVPADLTDEGDANWQGRSFALERRLDPETGLAAERLLVVRGDGARDRIDLPGEACGARERFGRPYYRIAADGRTALDLRFVDGGCHAVGIDLESGAWTRLDRSDAPATCAEERVVPAAHLGVGLRNWVRELRQAVVRAGADPQAAFVLHVAPDGAAEVETRRQDGTPARVAVPDFPLATPLRRIDVSVVSDVTPGGTLRVPPAAAGYEPL